MKKLLWHDLVLQGLAKIKVIDDETVSQLGHIAMGYAVVSSKLFARNVMVPLHDYAVYRGWSKPFAQVPSGRAVYNRPTFLGKYRGPPLGSIAGPMLIWSNVVLVAGMFEGSPRVG